MREKITLEDINTWLLKYGELDAPKYSMPHVDITGVLYRGNVNRVEDFISLPNGVEFTVYFENRPITEILLSEDFGDVCNLRVVTKSYYPYVNSDVRLSVPVETKHLESLEDLNGYDYGYIDTLSNVTGVINNDIHIVLSDGAIFEDCDLTFDADVTMNGELTINNSFIINNSILKFNNVNFNASNIGLDYLIVNNGTLQIRESNIESASPFILNKGDFVLEGNNINCDVINVSFIYSNNIQWNIQDNTINYSTSLEYKDFGVCFIRCNDGDYSKLIIDNNFNYENVHAIIDDINYLINGLGLCYAKLDDDTVYVKDLEVVENL